MKTMKFNARTFRFILAAGLFLILAAGVGGFYFAQKILHDYAEETRALNSQAAASDENIASLEKIKSYLEKNTDRREKVAQVVAESKQYRYQDDVINDLTSYAHESGVVIESFRFSSGQATPGTTAPVTVAPSGITPTTITITMGNPISYDEMLRFIRRIEQNVTKMQIANMAFTRSYENGKSNVSVSSLSIEVYLRK